MVSDRSRLSLCQFLGLQDRHLLSVLFRKHGISTNGIVRDTWRGARDLLEVLPASLASAGEEQLQSLLNEITGTMGDLRARVSPRYRFDQRLDDLRKCLLLDGYTIEGGRITPVEPDIEGAAAVEDDLTRELRISGLPEAEGILRSLESSADAFRRNPPDFNACLSTARVALQTLATAISTERLATHPGSFDEGRWGQVLAYLRTSGLVTTEEERGLAGVFTFVSPGAHQPVGIEESEMARLGRALIVSMCYFLVKAFSERH